MVSGRVTGRESQAGVYIMELKSFRMAAVLFDTRSKRLHKIAGREMGEDLRGDG